MKKKLFWLITLMVILLGTYFIHPFILGGMARYLIVQDKLQKADVIIVLAGDGNGERVEEGVKSFKQGYAKYILMSGGPLAWHLTNAEWMKKQAMADGIPASAILLEDKSRSTIDNAQFSLPVILKHHFGSAIVVTSPYHTRRAARTFRKVFSKQGIKVMIRPTEKSEFNPDRWWTRHEDTGAVVWEYAASVLYFFKGY